MFGPKLDPRSYTTLLLVVIAVLLALNLVAQPTGRQPAYDLRSADPTAAVAEATAQVAAANREIAAALQSVAAAISAIDFNINVEAPKTGATGTTPAAGSLSATTGGAAAAPAPADAEPRYQGSISF
ncbi:MAG: hypothetical protein KF858_07695 [Candidatus Sumerlaeia bacterium]|nr:hypothetical protein [Candidatus Sumerlaeia bacterium]